MSTDQGRTGYPAYAKAMMVHGAVLIVAGFSAFALAGFEEKARTALIFGGGSGALMVGMGVLSAAKSKGAKMAGIHLGLIFALVFTGAFAWRASKAYAAGPSKLVLAVILVIMALASLVSFVTILRMRPRPSER